MSEHYLKSLFNPSSIALIGASSRAKTLGQLIFEQLHTVYSGALHLVNPHHKTIRGVKCHSRIKTLPEGIDLAIVVTPLKSIPKIILECGKKGIKDIVVLTPYSDGYIATQQNEILEAANKANVRLLGPGASCLIRTSSNLNASSSKNRIQTGKLALVTRSKSIANSILDWADKQEVGFSSVISYGMELDLCLSDILEFLVNDSRTSSIILQLDKVLDTRRFMSALTEAAKRKPVVILKTGHDIGSYSDAITKTSDVRSMDDVFHSALTRAGVDRVYTLASLFAAAKILASNQRTHGTRLGIISNGKGPILLANDRLRHLRLEVPILSNELARKLTANQNTTWGQNNSVLVSNGETIATAFTEATKIMLSSDEIDAVALIFAPDATTDPLETAKAIIDAVKKTYKPVLVIWLGDSMIADSRHLLTDNKISNYRTPEAAIDAFSFLCTHMRNRNLLLQVPYPLSKAIPADIDSAKKIIQRNLEQRRRVLSQIDSRLLLEAFHIPCTPSRHASSIDEALKIADDLGYPVVLKIDSPNITYKSDVNGVILNIRNAKELKKACKSMLESAKVLRPTAIIDGVIVESMYAPKNGRELMIRIINDPAFGPVISFGAGGTRSPALRDRAIQLPPLNRRLADNLINNTQVSLLLNEFRNMPAAKRVKLRKVLIRVSEIACELPQVFELTINPLVLDENQAMVNNAQVIVQRYSETTRNMII